MKLTTMILMLALLALALPSTSQAKPSRAQNTTLMSLPMDVRVEVRSEFVATHATAVEMRQLRIHVVELRRLATRYAALRASSR